MSDLVAIINAHREIYDTDYGHDGCSCGDEGARQFRGPNIDRYISEWYAQHLAEVIEQYIRDGMYSTKEGETE